MEDLSSIYERLGGDPVTSLSPTSMSAGNMQSSSRLAMTAAGSPPVDPLPPASQQGDPAITAENYDTPVLIDAAGTKITPDNADRGNPFTQASGAWRSGRDISAPDVLPEVRGKPSIRLGRWNNL